MVNTVIMPKTGMAMEEGIIVKWLKREGETVEKGEPLVSIETDKSTMEVESDYQGTLLKQLYPEGTTVPVVTPIAYVGTPGEGFPPPIEEDKATAATTSIDAVAHSLPVDSGQPEFIPTISSRVLVKATPAARHAALDRGIDLSLVAPSGVHGEILLRDLPVIEKGTAPTAPEFHPSIGESTNYETRKAGLPLADGIALDIAELYELKRRLCSGLKRDITLDHLIVLAVIKILGGESRFTAIYRGESGTDSVSLALKLQTEIGCVELPTDYYLRSVSLLEVVDTIDQTLQGRSARSTASHRLEMPPLVNFHRGVRGISISSCYPGGREFSLMELYFIEDTNTNRQKEESAHLTKDLLILYGCYPLYIGLVEHFLYKLRQLLQFPQFILV